MKRGQQLKKKKQQKKLKYLQNLPFNIEMLISIFSINIYNNYSSKLLKINKNEDLAFEMDVDL